MTVDHLVGKDIPWIYVNKPPEQPNIQNELQCSTGYMETIHLDKFPFWMNHSVVLPIHSEKIF